MGTHKSKVNAGNLTVDDRLKKLVKCPVSTSDNGSKTNDNQKVVEKSPPKISSFSQNKPELVVAESQDRNTIFRPRLLPQFDISPIKKAPRRTGLRKRKIPSKASDELPRSKKLQNF